jgi:hypothetical protein
VSFFRKSEIAGRDIAPVFDKQKIMLKGKLDNQATP